MSIFSNLNPVKAIAALFHKPVNKNILSYMEASLLDDLTKLPNRRFFDIRIEDEWSRAIRGRYTLSFLIMDLDNFKSFNEKEGIEEGDSLLREVARIFSYCVNRTSDFAVRLEGETFCVILPNTREEGAKKIAENIRMSMERTGKGTVSIGIVSKTPNLKDGITEFISQAEEKLKQAKELGKNRICF